MKILICNIGTYVNRGDGAILIAMLNTFRQWSSVSQFDLSGSISSYSLVKEKEQVLIDMEPGFVTLPSFVAFGNFKKIFRKKYDMDNMLGKQKYGKNNNNKQKHSRFRNVVRSYAILFDVFIASYIPKKIFRKWFISQFNSMGVDFLSYDAVVMAGGTQLEDIEYDRYPGFAANLSAMVAATAAGIPLFVSGCSIGPISSKVGRYITKRLLEKASSIVLREADSQRYVQQKLGVTKPVEVGADWAFLLPMESFKDSPSDESDRLGAEARRRIAIIPRKTVFSLKKINEDNYLQEIANTIDSISELGGWLCTLVPQTIDPMSPQHDDFVTCKRIAELAKTEVRVVDTTNWTVGQLAAFLGGFDLIITRRMHAIIMAASASKGVPAIAISHIHKFDGLMAQVGLGELVIQDQEMNSEIVISRMRYFLENEVEILNILRERISVIKANALRNYDVIREQLEKTNSCK